MKGIVLGAAVATTVGAIDDFRRLPWWQKLGGQLLAAAIPTAGSASTCSASRSRSSACTEVPHWIGDPGDRDRDRRRDEHGQLPRRPRRARGGRVRDLRRDVLRDRARLRPRRPAVLAAIVCGACLGFLRHNFYPARIFMGDSGALLLGYTLATVSVQGLLKTAALATLVLPLLVLAVPVLDTSFVVAKRLKSGQPIYVADARHLHHRFMRIGFSRASRGRLPLDVVRDARARGARDAVCAAAPSRRLERQRMSRSTSPRASSPSRSRPTSSTCSRS